MELGDLVLRPDATAALFRFPAFKIAMRESARSDAKVAGGAPGLLFHDLRRSGVRRLVRAGVPERMALRIRGHKTRSVFEGHNITSKRDIEDAAKKLEAHHAENGDNSPAIQPPAQPTAPNALRNRLSFEKIVEPRGGIEPPT